MNDSAITDACVVFALRRESMAFRREFAPRRRFASAPVCAQFRGRGWLTVLLVECGVGTDAAQKAIHWLLSDPLIGNVPYRPGLVVSAGFSGALQPDQRVGDLVLATDIIDAQGNVWPASWPHKLPAGDQPLPLVCGRLLCLPTLLGDPAKKRRLGQKHQALAVDMESGVLARACQQKGVPFGALRVISDDLDMPLSPALVDVLKTGRVSPLRLIAAVVRSPRLIGELWRLSGQTRDAARQLARGLDEMLAVNVAWLLS